MDGKTVGEILKEQGITGERKEDGKKEEKKEEEKKISFIGEIRIKKLVMDLEKLRAEVDGLKEVKFSSDERIKELAENLGEIRSLLFQKDSIVKELEAKLKVIDDSVSDVEPRKISKQFQKEEQLPKEIILYWSDMVQERRRIKKTNRKSNLTWGTFSKGVDI